MMEGYAIEGVDTERFLSAMLQREKAKLNISCYIVLTHAGDDAAVFPYFRQGSRIISSDLV